MAAGTLPRAGQRPGAGAGIDRPIVQMRMAERGAYAAYASKLLQGYSERNAKVTAAVEAAVKDADAKGKDPLVAKRDAHAKAIKATEKDYEAKLSSLKAEHKAALAEAEKKGAVNG